MNDVLRWRLQNIGACCALTTMTLTDRLLLGVAAVLAVIGIFVAEAIRAERVARRLAKAKEIAAHKHANDSD